MVQDQAAEDDVEARIRQFVQPTGSPDERPVGNTAALHGGDRLGVGVDRDDLKVGRWKQVTARMPAGADG